MVNPDEEFSIELSIPDDLTERLVNAANHIKSTLSTIKVVSHYDGDGLSAGAIILATLIRLNKRFHITLQHNLEPKSKIISKLQKEENNLKIFSDLGSSRLDEIEGLKGWSIILDHHSPKRDTNSNNVIHINTHLFGINGTYELSASTLAFLLSIQISPKNWDLLSVALSGAISDKQHKNGFKGLNLQLLQTGLDLGILETHTGFKLPDGSIQQALERATDPYIIGLSNNNLEVEKILDEVNIDPSTNIQSLEKEKAQKLVSYIILKLLEQNVPPEDAEEFVTAKYYCKDFNMELENLSHIINASGRMGQMGIGVAAGLGDKKAVDQALVLRKKHKQYILDGLKNLEKERPKEMSNIQYFYESTAEFAGTFAGIGMMYFFNQSKPVIALTKNSKNIKVSGRGTNRLIKQGLDLSTILSKVSKTVGGNGGGHQIAAGATIPLGKDEDFLRIVNEEVGIQLKNDGKKINGN